MPNPMFALGLSLSLPVLAAEPGPTRVVIVRHAEKQGGENPSLTPPGLARAERLSRMLAGTPVDAVFSTDLCRTVQTVLPLARSRGLSVQAVAASQADLSGCQPTVADGVTRLPETPDAQAELVTRVRSLPPGSTAVVAGHSNTVPALVEALGAPSLCPDPLPLDEKGRCWLHHDAFDDVFIVSLGAGGSASTLRLSVPMGE